MKSPHAMKPVSVDTVLAAAEILGAHPHVDDETEQRVRALVDDDLTMRRLVDIIPEAFGLVVASHLPSASGMTLPDSFSVQDESGTWHSADRLRAGVRRGARDCPARFSRRPPASGEKQCRAQQHALRHQQCAR
ncbi:hypothetical protein [Burkholderia pseudomultivorans]|uniref:hypothetical protein n=1 Tax=Burkholderia pseudomultivorans TaxID=1207504 RepID=UPI0012DACCD3|nr:hypothetical protein [Burkholderia pseudomultivorans]